MTRHIVVTLLGVVVSCKESNAPSGPPPDVAGAWAFGQRLAGGGSTCANHGTVTVSQNGSLFTGTYSQTGFCSGPGGTTDNSGSGDITSGRLIGAALQFSAGGCSYRGQVVADPPDGASGTVTCQIQSINFSGTWHVSHGVASVTVTPGDVFIGTQATIPLTATAYDASGNVLAGRQVVWRSLQPAVATATNGTVLGVGVGLTTVTATTVPVAPLEDSVTAVANVRILTRTIGISAG